MRMCQAAQILTIERRVPCVGYLSNMSITAKIPILIGTGYLLGTIPSAIWVARSYGVDIYEVGSGNPGASNVYRVIGKKAAALVFVVDALKGVIPAALGRWIPGGAVTFGLLGGAAAVVGHTWPVFRRFKGGRGVATGAGVLAVCYPLLLLVALALFATVVTITRKPSVGSLAAIGTVLVGLMVIRPGVPEVVLTLGLVVIVLARHTENIKRLLKGEEHGLELDGVGAGSTEENL